MKAIRTTIGVLLMLYSIVLGQDTSRAPELKQFDFLQPVYTQVSANEAKEMEAEARKVGFQGTVKPGFQMVVKQQKAVNLMEMPKEEKEKAGLMTDPRNRSVFVLGGVDLTTYFFTEIPFPTALRDADGGTIRLIMQHEIAGDDQLRIIDEHIATEFDDDLFGRRGRSIGRYGWTRQSGGGEYAWILGDNVPHNLADPWGWAWILDYRWLQDNAVLPMDVIRIYSHPHVTTRVIIKD